MSIIIGLFWLLTWTTAAIAGIGLYLLPTGIALARKAPEPALVAILNIVFGATVIGWFGALLLALRTRRDGPANTTVTVINQPTGQPPLPPAPPVPPHRVPPHAVPPPARPTAPQPGGRHRRPVPRRRAFHRRHLRQRY